MLNKIKQVKKIVKICYRPIVKQLYLSGHKTWPTKSYEVWLFMQFLLFKSTPKFVIELGSGRSTHYFAEYCQKKDALLFSIEQNSAYLKKTKVGLESSFLKPKGLYYVPIKGDWFDIDRLRKILGDNIADFILIDAPGGGGGGSRNSIAGNIFLKKVTRQSSVIVVDDFHRDEVKRSVSILLSDPGSEYIPFLFTYPIFNNQNEILFLVKPELSESCMAFIHLLGLGKNLKEFSNSFADDLSIQIHAESPKHPVDAP